MSYIIEGGIWSSVFAVPCTVVDDHILMCPSLSMKVLLLMLRHPGVPMDTIWLSEQLHSAPSDIQDAVGYWINAGIITDGVTRTASSRAAAAPRPMPEAIPTPPPAQAVVSEKNIDGQRIVTTAARPHISRGDVSEISKNDPSMGQLLREAQSILGGPLSPVDSEILAALYTYYGLPADVVLMLLSYCVAAGKTSMHTVEKLAASWADRSINTHERAEQEILRLTQSGENESKVIRAFHIQGRGLSAKEKEYAERWFALGMDEKLIDYACESTLDRTGKASFAYADKIITSWKAKGINTIRAAMDEQKANAGKFTPPQSKSAQTAGSSIDKDALDAFIDGQFSD